jgi:hypothetical protein
VNASDIFLTLMIVLVIFNFGCVLMSGDPYTMLENMAIGGVLSVLLVAVVTAILSGVNVLETGLNPASTHIIFGMGVLLSLLFQISFEAYGFTIAFGVGLLSNVFNTFAMTDLMGIPFFMVTAIGLAILASGLMTITGGGGGA